MKILIVYDTGSVNKNTEKVAKAMSEVLKEKGFDVDCQYANDVNVANVKNYVAYWLGHRHKRLGQQSLLCNF